MPRLEVTDGLCRIGERNDSIDLRVQAPLVHDAHQLSKIYGPPSDDDEACARMADEGPLLAM